MELVERFVLLVSHRARQQATIFLLVLCLWSLGSAPGTRADQQPVIPLDASVESGISELTGRWSESDPIHPQTGPCDRWDSHSIEGREQVVSMSRLSHYDHSSSPMARVLRYYLRGHLDHEMPFRFGGRGRRLERQIPPGVPSTPPNISG